MKWQDQILYDELFEISDNLGYDTYADKPLYTVPYPFVYIRSVDISPRALKTHTYGVFDVSIEIYALSRKETSDMAQALLDKMQRIETDQAIFTLNRNATTIREFVEDVANEEKIHYLLIETEFKNL